MASRCDSRRARVIRRGRRSRLLSYFWAIVLAAVAAAGLAGPAAAQTPPGWTLAASPHIQVFTVTGDAAGAARGAEVSAELARLYREVIAPLGVRPLVILYPLFPSAERYRADWWLFASQGYGDLVYAWGTIDHGAAADVSLYAITRAVVARVFPRAIPFLRWGLGDALADRAAGVDPHRHVQALAASGQSIPGLVSVLPPADFGSALPVSYPVAVSFMAYLLDTYGPARTARFVADVEYKYYDFGTLFEAHFGTTLEAAERRWRSVTTRAPEAALDLSTYLAVTQFVYRTTLAGSPGQVLLESEGATVVDEAFRAILPLRRLAVAEAAAYMDTAIAAEERAERRSRLTTTTTRSLIGLLIAAPILLAIGWLVWPSVRAKLAQRRGAVLRREGQRP